LRLIFYVTPYNIRRDLIPHTSHKVPVTPQFTCPQLLPEPWKHPKYLPCRSALHNLHNLSRRIPRRHFQEYMHMVFHYFLRVYPELVFIRYLLKHFLSVLSNLSCQDMLPILGYPYNMVLQIKHGMLRPSNSHAALIQEETVSKQISLPRLTASRFPPVSKLTGIQRGSL
jgi:hypothetical protein